MFKRLLLVSASLFVYASANAAVVQGEYLGTFSGNDSEAAMLAAIDAEVIQLARVDTPETSHDGLEITNLVFNDDDEPVAGDWSYSGPGVVDYIVIKAGREFAVYRYTDANTSNMRNLGIWDTSGVNDRGLSHITAYQAVVPVPAALWLLGPGLVTLGFVRRRK